MIWPVPPKYRLIELSNNRAIYSCTGTNPIYGVEIVYDKIGGSNVPMIVVTGAT